MRWISKAAHSALPLRGALGSNVVGAALSLVPQAFVDAKDSGLFDNPSDSKNWGNFAVAEARGQSGNLAGIVGGMVRSQSLLVSQPHLRSLSSACSAARCRTGFNALGLNEAAASGMKWLLDKVAKM